MEFNIETVKKNIEKCKLSIESFEKEEQVQQQTIEDYRKMIVDGDSSFPVQSLENGIQNSEKNLVVIRDAIQRERDMIQLLYKQIEHNQNQVLLEKEKLSHIEIVKE